MPAALPVDPFIPSVLESLGRHRAAVVVAAPGAGKTTRIPPALTGLGRVILLQPRRIAARAIARRIAAERHWTLGREVGWHVRYERQFSDQTRLLVATEGILTARVQQDPLLSDFRVIVLDEFHERSIHADLGIALAKQAWRARDDLHIVIMSATLDARRASAFLHGCPVIDVPGTQHPVEVRYAPGISVADAAKDMLARTSGNVLVFLPGAAEVRRAAASIGAAGGGAIDVVELHGSLSAEEQDGALTPSDRRRVVVATNIAETSLTVPGISAVVDTGQHKVARYDAARGVDSLDLERISEDAADQRAGRAGRLGPGAVLRLWDERDRLRAHREPDIARIDLSGPVLDVLAWGGDPRVFEWYEPPPSAALISAIDLLVALGALRDGSLTEVGRRMSRLSLHPRLARILIAANGAHEAAVACALLSDRLALPRHPATTSCDLLAGLDRELPPHVSRMAGELARAAGADGRRSIGEHELRHVLLAGYPDRVGQRRTPAGDRVLMTSGHGGVIGPESGVRAGEFILALDVQAGRRGEQSEARIRIASIVDKDWLGPTSIDREHGIDDDGTFRMVERERYGSLVLTERPVPPDPAVAAVHLAAAYLEAPRSDADEQLVRRLRFARIDVDLHEIAQRAAAGRRKLGEMHLADGLDWQMRKRLDEDAPAAFDAPSGRNRPLEYRDDGTVALSIKLQELFGLGSTPRIGPGQEPLLIVLLAPNGRPVQTTRDLASFWNVTYPEVRRELRGRYPKHPWPEDPWAAQPTARTTKGARRT